MENKVTLIGGAGAPNFGDELILRGWIDYFNSHIKTNTEFLFLENGMKSYKLLKNFIHKNNHIFYFDNFLNEIYGNKNFFNLSFWEQIERGFNFVIKKKYLNYESNRWKFIFSSRVLHLHGGGYFNDLWPHKGFLIGFFAGIKLLTGCKLVATGIGFGPFNRVEKTELIEKIFDLFDLFEFRESNSFQKLKKIFLKANFIYGLDDIFLIKQKNLVLKDTISKKIYISFMKQNINSFDKNFWQNLRKISDCYNDVIFWESSQKFDHHVYQHISSIIPKTQYMPLEVSLGGMAEVNVNDLFISSRFHVHLIGAICGCNGLYLAKTKYYKIKHNSILDLGSPFEEIENIKNPNIEKSNFLAKKHKYYYKIKKHYADEIYNSLYK